MILVANLVSGQLLKILLLKAKQYLGCRHGFYIAIVTSKSDNIHTFSFMLTAAVCGSSGCKSFFHCAIADVLLLYVIQMIVFMFFLLYNLFILSCDESSCLVNRLRGASLAAILDHLASRRMPDMLFRTMFTAIAPRFGFALAVSYTAIIKSMGL